MHALQRPAWKNDGTGRLVTNAASNWGCCGATILGRQAHARMCGPRNAPAAAPRVRVARGWAHTRAHRIQPTSHPPQLLPGVHALKVLVLVMAAGKGRSGNTAGQRPATRSISAKPLGRTPHEASRLLDTARAKSAEHVMQSDMRSRR
jgi:hypothetical protein